MSTWIAWPALNTWIAWPALNTWIAWPALNTWPAWIAWPDLASAWSAWPDLSSASVWWSTFLAGGWSSSSSSIRAITLLLALLIDSLLGDPVVPWHPVRLLGQLATALEQASRRVFNAPARQAPAPELCPRCPQGPSAPVQAGSPQGMSAPVRFKFSQLCPREVQLCPRELLSGTVTWLFVTITACLLAWLLSRAAWSIHPLSGTLADAIIIWLAIAPCDLVRHARKVRSALRQDDRSGTGVPINGRLAVAMLVGRDVSVLDVGAVTRACIESVAESSIDGVAAPLFWAAVLGPWAALGYRAVNTMDSLFGHKNQRYLSFGLIPARADDVANWLPARLSAVLSCLVAPLVGGSTIGALRSLHRYRLAHASPNAGHPESAYAGALGLRLGGPLHYPEGWIDKPWINPQGREARPEDIDRAVHLMIGQTILSTACFIVYNFLQ
jgi:adenosylcobinamide-phosphate synthase